MERRSFLVGAGAGAVGAAVLPAAVSTTAQADSAPAAASGGKITFHGEHQAGILTPAPNHATFAVFDLTITDKAKLVDLMKALTRTALWITEGGSVRPGRPGEPPMDSGVLGPAIPADNVTVTVGFGASVFDQRFGLAANKPKHLTAMRTFPNDQLVPAETHGDVMVQICGDHADSVIHALRLVARFTRSWMQLRYKHDGFASPSRPDGAGRNLMGFKDGTSQPAVATDPKLADQLIWAGADEPAWAKGGSYLVFRNIRMLVEFWDRVGLFEQETMMGRKRDTGAPLGSAHETDEPDFAKDPEGKVIPLDAHMRLSNPRTAATDNQRILRRGYNYNKGVDKNGNLDMGLLFAAYQQDPVRQFEAIQTRLIDEPLVDYIVPNGGGYFFMLPGVTGLNDYYGKALLG